MGCYIFSDSEIFILIINKFDGFESLKSLRSLKGLKVDALIG
jgi:hypothetical protein